MFDLSPTTFVVFIRSQYLLDFATDLIQNTWYNVHNGVISVNQCDLFSPCVSGCLYHCTKIPVFDQDSMNLTEEADIRLHMLKVVQFILQWSLNEV